MKKINLNKKERKFVPNKKDNQHPKPKAGGTKREAKKEGLKDTRLDELVPLFVDMIGKLLAAKGMLRYRDAFVEDVKEIMEGKDAKKKR